MHSNTKLRAFRVLFGGVHMEKSTRRKFSDEFKEEAVKLKWSIKVDREGSAILD